MTAAETGFAGRYGPWALVAGASEGVGAAYARAMADRGLNVVLLARRQNVLDEVAVSIEADDRVAARSYVDAVVMGPNNATGSRSIGYYDDELVRTGDGWRIAHRRFTMVHLQLDLGKSASLAGRD
jgi:NAD(P)-dependent dehydrogenase (short-subunit alcohol dehydrogenase family)